MKVKLAIILSVIMLILGLGRVDYITNAYLGTPGYGLVESIKKDINNILDTLQKNR